MSCFLAFDITWPSPELGIGDETFLAVQPRPEPATYSLVVGNLGKRARRLCNAFSPSLGSGLGEAEYLRKARTTTAAGEIYRNIPCSPFGAQRIPDLGRAHAAD